MVLHDGVREDRHFDRALTASKAGPPRPVPLADADLTIGADLISLTP